jgi:SHS2 domain-containing protein
MNHRNPPSFEELAHTADLRLRVYGQDLRELFVHAAQGMFHLMHCEPVASDDPVTHAITLESFDLETLLIDWLSELIYLSEPEQECYTVFEITYLDAGAQRPSLEAVVSGMAHCPPQKVIKAATFSDLHVLCTPLGCEATITLDV